MLTKRFINYSRGDLDGGGAGVMGGGAEINHAIFKYEFFTSSPLCQYAAITFAITSEVCRNRPFARNFCGENENIVISFAKPFAFTIELIRSALFEI